MQLTVQQQLAIEKIEEFVKSDASIFILTGYAGTGKTTVLKQIANTLIPAETLVLMAPTGRAARVLQAKTGHEANTIHRTIYTQPQLESKEVKDLAESEFKLHFPIRPTRGPIIGIVDEASMLSSRTNKQELFTFGTDNLMDDLLTFIRPSFGGKIIFVGDPAQLPPVNDNKSAALDADFFIQKGLKVMQAELTEVLRQAGDSVLLKNAMQIRQLLERPQRNRLIFEEKKNEVEGLKPEELLPRYMEEKAKDKENDCIVICFSNQAASRYNQQIREDLYHTKKSDLREGDALMVIQNNYALDLMNGDFVQVQSVGEKIQQSAPVYVQEGGAKVRKAISLDFVSVNVRDANSKPLNCLLLLNLLNNGSPSLGIDEQRALYINFRIRHPKLKPGTEDFGKALQKDPYFNCLRAKYGYAVTGHKCQGGEWRKVFVDYSGRTGLSDDCLRWAYTATTRARETLYFTNLPRITPFSRFRIEPIQSCSKINEECRIIGDVEKSPFHASTAPAYLHAKWMCINTNMEWTPYHIDKIESKPYQEIYYINTPTGMERYDLRYKKGGIFLKAVPQCPTPHTSLICMLLDDEHAMPLIWDYTPSDETHQKLHELIRSACDGLGIPITNIVEHKEDYSVVFYFRTSGSLSYLKIYINNAGFITYAKPMSLLGDKDHELNLLIQEIQNHFEQ